MARPVDIGFDTPFAEQVEFFRRKKTLSTARWDDIKHGAHDRSFIVAGVMKGDILNGLQDAVAKAINQGSGLDTFKKDFWNIVEKHGWHGWTGEGTTAGEAWRIKTIFETNLRPSYAAGRYAQLTDPDLLSRRPYWQYVHSESVLHPRPEHLAWNGLTLPHDHPFWQTHFAPNGWGGCCRIIAVRKPAEGNPTSPPDGWDAINPKTGAPIGIDKGWAYTPGASTDVSMRQMVQDKLVTYPPAIGEALSRDVSRWISANADVTDFVKQALADKSFKQDLWLGFAPEKISEVVGKNLSGYLVLVPADAVKHVEKQHGEEVRKQIAPQPEDYVDAAKWLSDGQIVSEGLAASGHERLKVKWLSGAREYQSIWEIRPGKRNRSLSLVSMWIKQR